MNNYDRQYIQLLEDVLSNGTKKSDRTGVGTYSVFGRQMRLKMSDGYPLLTTKKIFTKAMLHELLWFLKGGDNIKYLVDNDVRIWNEWPYERYVKQHKKLMEDTHTHRSDYPILSMQEFIEKIKTDDEFAAEWGKLGPVYGSQWIKWNGRRESAYDGENISVNQIDQMIEDLRKNPDSRRIMVSAWNVAQIPDMLLPPCHYAFQLWTGEMTAAERESWYHKNKPVKLVAHINYNSADVQEDKVVNNHIHEFLDKEGVPKRKISLMFHMRSVDCFLGMPFDIASYATLLHMIAHCTDMVADEVIITSGDTHIYLNHLEQVKLQMSRTPYKLPSFKFKEGVSKNIYEITYEDLHQAITDYECHPAIKADVAV